MRGIHCEYVHLVRNEAIQRKYLKRNPSHCTKYFQGLFLFAFLWKEANKTIAAYKMETRQLTFGGDEGISVTEQHVLLAHAQVADQNQFEEKVVCLFHLVLPGWDQE